VSLAAPYRLRHRKDFSAVYRAGVRCHGSTLILRALRQPAVADEPSRLGVSISQKVSKRAVVRNRIKRQIKAAFRQLLPRIPGGWWLVVVVNPAALQCEYGQFLRELEELLIRAEVIDGHSRRSAV
jgi:ribonuclease P protein component